MDDIIKRIGTFKINRNYIYENAEEVLRFLNDILVVKTDYDFQTNSIIYVGYSKHFDISDEGLMPLIYDIEINSITNEIKWHRKFGYSEKDVKSILEEIKDEIKKNKTVININ